MRAATITAANALVPLSSRLGEDGAGLDIALSVALPTFQILNASCSIGMMDAATEKTVAHATTTHLEHLNLVLADQPVTRQHIAVMKNCADAARALVDDAIAALAIQPSRCPPSGCCSRRPWPVDAALEVLDVAMRVGGGAAFRNEIGIERHFRDGPRRKP